MAAAAAAAEIGLADDATDNDDDDTGESKQNATEAAIAPAAEAAVAPAPPQPKRARPAPPVYRPADHAFPDELRERLRHADRLDPPALARLLAQAVRNWSPECPANRRAVARVAQGHTFAAWRASGVKESLWVTGSLWDPASDAERRTNPFPKALSGAPPFPNDHPLCPWASEALAALLRWSADFSDWLQLEKVYCTLFGPSSGAAAATAATLNPNLLIRKDATSTAAAALRMCVQALSSPRERDPGEWLSEAVQQLGGVAPGRPDAGNVPYAWLDHWHRNGCPIHPCSFWGLSPHLAHIPNRLRLLLWQAFVRVEPPDAQGRARLHVRLPVPGSGSNDRTVAFALEPLAMGATPVEAPAEPADEEVDAAVEALCTLLDDVYQRIKADLAQTAVAAAGAAAVAPATPVHRMWGSMDLLSIDEGLVSALNGAPGDSSLFETPVLALSLLLASPVARGEHKLEAIECFALLQKTFDRSNPGQRGALDLVLCNPGDGMAAAQRVVARRLRYEQGVPLVTEGTGRAAKRAAGAGASAPAPAPPCTEGPKGTHTGRFSVEFLWADLDLQHPVLAIHGLYRHKDEERPLDALAAELATYLSERLRIEVTPLRASELPPKAVSYVHEAAFVSLNGAPRLPWADWLAQMERRGRVTHLVDATPYLGYLAALQTEVIGATQSTYGTWDPTGAAGRTGVVVAPHLDVGPGVPSRALLAPWSSAHAPGRTEGYRGARGWQEFYVAARNKCPEILASFGLRFWTCRLCGDAAVAPLPAEIDAVDLPVWCHVDRCRIHGMPSDAFRLGAAVPLPHRSARAYRALEALLLRPHAVPDAKKLYKTGLLAIERHLTKRQQLLHEEAEVRAGEAGVGGDEDLPLQHRAKDKLQAIDQERRDWREHSTADPLDGVYLAHMAQHAARAHPPLPPQYSFTATDRQAGGLDAMRSARLLLTYFLAPVRPPVAIDGYVTSVRALLPRECALRGDARPLQLRSEAFASIGHLGAWNAARALHARWNAELRYLVSPPSYHLLGQSHVLEQRRTPLYTHNVGQGKEHLWKALVKPWSKQTHAAFQPTHDPTGGCVAQALRGLVARARARRRRLWSTTPRFAYKAEMPSEDPDELEALDDAPSIASDQVGVPLDSSARPRYAMWMERPAVLDLPLPPPCCSKSGWRRADAVVQWLWAALPKHSTYEVLHQTNAVQLIAPEAGAPTVLLLQSFLPSRWQDSLLGSRGVWRRHARDAFEARRAHALGETWRLIQHLPTPDLDYTAACAPRQVEPLATGDAPRALCPPAYQRWLALELASLRTRYSLHGLAGMAAGQHRRIYHTADASGASPSGWVPPQPGLGRDSLAVQLVPGNNPLGFAAVPRDSALSWFSPPAVMTANEAFFKSDQPVLPPYALLDYYAAVPATLSLPALWELFRERFTVTPADAEPECNHDHRYREVMGIAGHSYAEAYGAWRTALARRSAQDPVLVAVHVLSWHGHALAELGRHHLFQLAHAGVELWNATVEDAGSPLLADANAPNRPTEAMLPLTMRYALAHEETVGRAGDDTDGDSGSSGDDDGDSDAGGRGVIHTAARLAATEDKDGEAGETDELPPGAEANTPCVLAGESWEGGKLAVRWHNLRAALTKTVTRLRAGADGEETHTTVLDWQRAFSTVRSKMTEETQFLDDFELAFWTTLATTAPDTAVIPGTVCSARRSLSHWRPHLDPNAEAPAYKDYLVLALRTMQTPFVRWPSAGNMELDLLFRRTTDTARRHLSDRVAVPLLATQSLRRGRKANAEEIQNDAVDTTLVHPFRLLEQSQFALSLLRVLHPFLVAPPDSLLAGLGANATALAERSAGTLKEYWYFWATPSHWWKAGDGGDLVTLRKRTNEALALAHSHWARTKLAFHEIRLPLLFAKTHTKTPFLRDAAPARAAQDLFPFAGPERRETADLPSVTVGLCTNAQGWGADEWLRSAAVAPGDIDLEGALYHSRAPLAGGCSAEWSAVMSQVKPGQALLPPRVAEAGARRTGRTKAPDAPFAASARQALALSLLTWCNAAIDYVFHNPARLRLLLLATLPVLAYQRMAHTALVECLEAGREREVEKTVLNTELLHEHGVCFWNPYAEFGTHAFAHPAFVPSLVFPPRPAPAQRPRGDVDGGAAEAKAEPTVWATDEAVGSVESILCSASPESRHLNWWGRCLAAIAHLLRQPVLGPLLQSLLLSRTDDDATRRAAVATLATHPVVRGYVLLVALATMPEAHDQVNDMGSVGRRAQRNLGLRATTGRSAYHPLELAIHETLLQQVVRPRLQLSTPCEMPGAAGDLSRPALLLALVDSRTDNALDALYWAHQKRRLLASLYGTEDAEAQRARLAKVVRYNLPLSGLSATVLELHDPLAGYVNAGSGATRRRAAAAASEASVGVTETRAIAKPYLEGADKSQQLSLGGHEDSFWTLLRTLYHLRLGALASDPQQRDWIHHAFRVLSMAMHTLGYLAHDLATADNPEEAEEDGDTSLLAGKAGDVAHSYTQKLAPLIPVTSIDTELWARRLFLTTQAWRKSHPSYSPPSVCLPNVSITKPPLPAAFLLNGQPWGTQLLDSDFRRRLLDRVDGDGVTAVSPFFAVLLVSHPALFCPSSLDRAERICRAHPWLTRPLHVQIRVLERNEAGLPALSTYETQGKLSVFEALPQQELLAALRPVWSKVDYRPIASDEAFVLVRDWLEQKVAYGRTEPKKRPTAAAAAAAAGAGAARASAPPRATAAAAATAPGRQLPAPAPMSKRKPT